MLWVPTISKGFQVNKTFYKALKWMVITSFHGEVYGGLKHHQR